MFAQPDVFAERPIVMTGNNAVASGGGTANRRRPLPQRRPRDSPHHVNKEAPARLGTLHQRTFGTDVLKYCGGRRRLHAVHATPVAPAARLAEFGVPLPPARRRLRLMGPHAALLE